MSKLGHSRGRRNDKEKFAMVIALNINTATTTTPVTTTTATTATTQTKTTIAAVKTSATTMVEVGYGGCLDAQSRVPNRQFKKGSRSDCYGICLDNKKCTGAAYCSSSSCSGGSCELFGTQLTKDNTADGWEFGSGTGSDVITQANGKPGWVCKRKTTLPATTTPGTAHTTLPHAGIAFSSAAGDHAPLCPPCTHNR